MPADPRSYLVLIVLTAADTVAGLWPYVVGGIVAAVVMTRLAPAARWRAPRLRRPALAVPLAALAGAASPVPTLSTTPLVVQLRAGSRSGSVGLAFTLASSMMNPQLFILTLGALGVRFALVQLLGVLLLSIGVAFVVGRRKPDEARDGSQASHETGRVSFWNHLAGLASHVGFYFLVGALVGAGLQVLLSGSGVLGWMGQRGWLSSPLLGWLVAPFYTCMGSAVPLAASLSQMGVGPGALLAFLLIGPALRGTTLASLGALLPKRALVVCLAAVLVGGALLGSTFQWVGG